MTFGRLALHSWTLDTTPLETVLDAAHKGGFDALELRRKDFTTCFDRGMSNEEVLGLVRGAALPVCVLGVEYGWMFAHGQESRRLFGVFEESCANAAALGCPMVMSAAGPYSGPVRDAIAHSRTAADIAAAHGLTLALEFNSQHEVVNSLEVLREIVDGVGRPNCGMLLDAYHLERSGRGGRGFADVGPAELVHFQYSDVSPNPVTGVKRPMDRLEPGEGVVRWREALGLLRELNFEGFLSYEAPNAALWERSPYEVARAGAERTRALVADALEVVA